MAAKRKRRFKSIADNLVYQSREAALSAVQIFNNPTSKFKSESYIVLMIIAWTYLLHAYYRRKGVDYRYYEKRGKRKRYIRTSDGQIRHWDLTKCLKFSECPIDRDTKNNLRFLIGLRNVIEHQMAVSLDDYLSGRYHACALNFATYITKLHGDRFGIEDHLSYTIQFRDLMQSQIVRGSEVMEGIPSVVSDYINEFDNSLADDEFNSRKFSERLIFTRKLANRPGQADRAVEFLDPESAAGKELNKLYVVLKETERRKFLPSEIVQIMRDEGYVNFNMHHHTRLWQSHNAKEERKGFGTYATEQRKQWYWYESWLTFVRNHCEENRQKYCN
ncbi:MAG: DUF3644 domain-containing protein [Anaerolineaceae bacterium]|nr:DUF3644 domain-containing protein [Anaerolineaceae bacterium]